MNENLRGLIHIYRVNKHLNFRELAELCGYKNSNKWASRICNFEREGYGPDEMIRRLIKSLQIPVDEVRTANRLDLEKYHSWLDQPVRMELLIKPLPGVYFKVDIPDYVDSPEKAVQLAASKSIQLKSETCLILSRKKCIWFNPDGSLKFKRNSGDGFTEPFMTVSNKRFIFKMV